MNTLKQFFSFYILFGSLLLVVSCSHEKRTLQLNQVPTNTPDGETIYVSGTFNKWNPADERYQMTYDATSKTYSIELPEGVESGEYYYTRSNIETRETDMCGNEIVLRSLSKELVQQDTVVGWRDLDHPECPQVTFEIRAKRGKFPLTENIYLTTEALNWQSGHPDYRFQRISDSSFVLRFEHPPTHPLMFNLFRNGVRQFTTPQQATVFNDTIRMSVDLLKSNDVDNADKKTLSGKAAPIASGQTPPKQTGSITLDAPVVTSPVPSSPEAPTSGVEDNPGKAVVPAVVVKAESEPEKDDKQKKVFVILDRLPAYGKGDNLYVAGDFNDWNIADEDYRFKTLYNGKKFLELRFDDTQPHEFKITRGEPGTDEAGFKEEAIDFHEIAGGKDNDTLHIRIESWMDAYPRKRLVFYLVDVPDGTPEKDGIYLTGDFNSWDMRDEEFRFQPLGKHRYVLTIEDFSSAYKSYKISRGSRETEAVAANGKVPKPQAFDFIKRDTIRLRIEGWKDIDEK